MMISLSGFSTFSSSHAQFKNFEFCKVTKWVVKLEHHWHDGGTGSTGTRPAEDLCRRLMGKMLDVSMMLSLMCYPSGREWWTNCGCLLKRWRMGDKINEPDVKQCNTMLQSFFDGAAILSIFSISCSHWQISIFVNLSLLLDFRRS